MRARFYGRYMSKRRKPKSSCDRKAHAVIRDTIEEKLTAAYAPDALEIIDESHLHAGHNEAAAHGETHFRVRMTSAAFDGVSRLDRQRQVLALLADELNGPVHALALKLTSPAEAARQQTD